MAKIRRLPLANEPAQQDLEVAFAEIERMEDGPPRRLGRELNTN